MFADLVDGQRNRNAVRAVTCIGLDIDTGTPVAKIDLALKNFGCLAVRYTTHSHNRTETEFSMDVVAKFVGSVEDITTESVRRYCLHKEWESTIVDTVELVASGRHGKTGMMVVISHDPMPKNRVIVPLHRPYDIAEEIRNGNAKTQMEAVRNYALLPAALADHLQVPMDKACTDPCRLFYTPRHAKGREYSISLFGGVPFDYNTLDPIKPDPLKALASEANKKGAKSKTEKGRELGRWSAKTAHGFQIATLLEDCCPDKLRGRATMGFNVECPFDAGHSNAGDTEDRACFAVNAADGGNEIFIISCRHTSCQGYTNLDMLGRMITDRWFDEDLIRDENYNAVLDDEVNASSSGNAPNQDNLESSIASLSGSSSLEDIHVVLRMVLNRAPLVQDEAIKAIHKKTEKGIRPLKAQLAFEAKSGAQASGPATGGEISEKLEIVLSEARGQAFVYPPEEFRKCKLGMFLGRPWLLDKSTSVPLTTPFVVAGGVTFADRNNGRATRIEVFNPLNTFTTVDLDAALLARYSGGDVLESLMAAGLAFQEQGRRFVLDLLCASQLKGPTVYHYPGWRDGAFLCPTGQVLLATRPVELAKEVALKCAPTAGSFAEWKAAADHIFNQDGVWHLQTGVLLGLAGCLAGLCDDATLGYSLDGPTSLGKSSMQAAAAANWADPKIGKGLFQSAHGTEGSNEGPLQMGSGTVACLGEVSQMPPEAQYKLLFMKEEGVGKRRMTRTGGCETRAHGKGAHSCIQRKRRWHSG